MMARYNRENNLFVESKNENSHWRKILLLGAALFSFFFWLLPIGLKLLISLIMNNPEASITNDATQVIADGMNGIVGIVVTFSVYGLKIFAIVVLTTAVIGAIRSYFKSR